ncbi:MAG: efflux transporter, outer rane factor lipoprotein NodT family [Hydrocarboniphaga sp.]|uniref:efflux transporter outer membrane subunit n=1 Tax=Hydrocarboniphaga sp. TaxID=2033016 RepID=UPI00263013DB|nr:efflux transporter outer membrane subunit [Hydrocarboniphaga sp.]MDB5970061.1 efflux transporter, outer rane factor lipoprotein NodT family [Hydrocarboniphaga sp.]
MRFCPAKAVTGLALATAFLLVACVAPPVKSTPTLRQLAPVEQNEAVAGAAVWPVADWWKTFGDPQLDELIGAALQGSPSLKTAQARIAAADAASALAQAQSGVQLAATADISRNQLSENGLISSRLLGFDWYSQADAALQFQANLDWWGRQRSAITAAVDRGRAAEAEAAASRLILITAIASEYLSWQSDTARLDIAEQQVSLFARWRDLQQLRSQQGLDDGLPLYQLDVETDRARDAVLLREASRQRHRLAIAALAGVVPDELLLERTATAIVPALDAPSDLGLGLIARRPDIVASRWRVEAAVQNVDEVRAAYYPDLRLSALAGLSSLQLSKLADTGSQAASLGAALYLPIFDIRGLRAQYGVRKANLDSAVAAYDEVVVGAAQDVATRMLDCKTLLGRRETMVQRLLAAEKVRLATETRVSQGMDDRRSEITAQTQFLSTRDAALQIDAELALARLALIQSLGGGLSDGLIRAPPA